MGRRRDVVIDETQNASRTVPVVSIANDPQNKRDSSEAYLRGLADSIDEVGLLQPIGVMRYEVYLTHFPQFEEQVGTHDWVALFGNDRLRACRLTDLAEVPVTVMDRLGREGKIRTAVLIENIQRSEYPPLAEAEALKELAVELGSQGEVAKRLGVSPGFVSQRLKLLKLVPELRAAVAAGALRIEDARKLAGVAVSKQPAAWRELEAERKAAGQRPDLYAVNTGDGASSKAKSPRSQNPSPAAPKNKTAGQERDLYAVNTSDPVTITLDDPQSIANQLQEHLTADAFSELVGVLLERVEH